MNNKNKEDQTAEEGLHFILENNLSEKANGHPLTKPSPPVFYSRINSVQFVKAFIEIDAIKKTTSKLHEKSE